MPRAKKSAGGSSETAYCVRCKRKTHMSSPQRVAMKKKGGKTGYRMAGRCNDCGTKTSRIVS